MKPGSIKSDLTSNARDAADSKPLEWGARLGLVARGLIYVLIGVFALQIATGSSGKQADRGGATRQLATSPFGTALLWLLVVGFACLALWRLSEVAFGAAEPDGRKAGPRAKSAFRAVLYGAFAVSTALYVTGRSQGAAASGEKQSKNVTATVMEHTGGRWLVGLAGAAFVVAGVVLGAEAVRKKYQEHMRMAQMSPTTRKVVDVLGVAGGVARGVVFALVGVFLVTAAIQFDPAKARGLDGSLRALADTPAGPWLLGLVALGLVMFGAFSGAEARWRRT